MILEQIVDKKKYYKEGKVTEVPARSVAKSVSWRILGTLDTILISWIVTGNTSVAFSIGGIELVTKIVLYFFHERLWNIIKWGKK